MKKIFIIAFVAVLSVSLAGCEWIKWRRYKNPEYKFSLLIMRDWLIDEDAEEAPLVVYLPQLDSKSQFRTNFRVSVQDLPVEVQLTTYYDINREELKQVFPRQGNLKEGQGMAGFVRYQWLSFDAQIAEGVIVRVINAVWVKGKRVYVFSCAMEFNAIGKFEPLIQKTISSFRI